jgi:serine phosphatase RsbU (regulator of sigma subunit)
LVISGPKETWQVPLDAKGATLGRDSRCDIVLKHKNISRSHARIYQDPFGRWIIEDLDSQNGVLIDGEPVKAHAILPNQKIDIRPFTLSISQEYERHITPDSSVHGDVSVIDKGLEEEVVSYDADRDTVLSASLIKRLNELTSGLLELQSPSQLYSQASTFIAQMLDALVVFVRLPPASEPLPDSPRILARHFGRAAIDQSAPQASNIHLSKRVLNAVRSTNTPIMARSGPSPDKQLVLTVRDEVTPHVVFAAPINDFEGTIDALYLDVLESKLPDEMFDFVEAVARQISSAQESLIFLQAKAERQKLDQQLTLARDIQSRLTPKESQFRFDVDVAVCYEPAMWVGGDYCDAWSLDDGRVAFAVGDVSGKGLPAAMIMSNLQAALRTTMNFCTELSTVAEHVNKHLCQSLQDEMFVTLFLGLFDPSINKLSYVNAGHIPPLIMQPKAPAKHLGEAKSIPLGIFTGPYEMAEETLHPGTALLVVTDGITEAESPDDKRFEMKNLSILMTKSQAASAKELVQAVIKKVTVFRKKLPQHDDITVFALLNQKPTAN